MTQPSTRRARALLLLAAVAIALAASAQQPTALSPKPITFAVVSIRPSNRGGWSSGFNLTGYRASGASLRWVVMQDAYAIYDDKLITGTPAWWDSAKFDIEAKVDDADIDAFQHLPIDQRRQMLQAVLADRFDFKVHFETKQFPVFNLVIAKGGPKLQPTKPEDIQQGPMGPVCLVQKNSGGSTQRRGCPVDSLDDLLRYNTGRTVIDKTGLTGRYNVELHWTPENTPADSPAAVYPTIFNALQEQLGLKLEPSTAPLSILVIDSADKPTPN